MKSLLKAALAESSGGRQGVVAASYPGAGSTAPSPPSGVTVNPRPLSRAPPDYPDRAEEDQIEGYVDFDFIIEPDSSVGHPKVVVEAPEAYGFADSAMVTFPQWKFTPKIVDGAPVPSPARIRISFRLAR